MFEIGVELHLKNELWRMLLVVKILFLQSVMGGFQNSFYYSLVLLPYSISLTLIPFVSKVSLVSLLPLFFPFSKPPHTIYT